MKYTKEQLEVMSQAEFDNQWICTNIQRRDVGCTEWENCPCPAWSWENTRYRIKPGPTYAERQSQWCRDNNITSGSKVKIIGEAAHRYLGWENCWNPAMTNSIGQTRKVKAPDTAEPKGLLLSDGWLYPYFCLEAVKEPKYIPYTNEDNIVGKIVVENGSTAKRVIVMQGNFAVEVGGKNDSVEYKELLNNYRFVNKQGKPYKPCGKEVRE